MDPRVKILGIRHHGPGSAASLVRALEAIGPEEVLVELPADARDVLAFAGAPGMRPPVALLLHDAKDPSRASFYPFATYSPEWQALLFALRTGTPVVPIDLPTGSRLGPEGEDRRLEPEQAARTRDPLDAFAELAGHASGEAWWDALVERTGGGLDLFEAITRAMSELRSGLELPEDADCERREAHMVRTVRESLERTEGPVAVVVGAWHAPAIQSPMTRKRERELLKGTRPKKVEATWVPWTEDRLARHTGYGAGVRSPGWYAHLWRERGAIAMNDEDRVVGAWMARVARLLREEGKSAGVAHAIDATRLALQLASVRGVPAPGLDEVVDATLATICAGDERALDLVWRRAIVGDALGEVDPAVPMMPLAADLARLQKRLRLKPESLPRALALDLRTESGSERSRLLHRLRMIGVHWGQLEDARAGRGTFREVWTLEWTPELSVALAEALRFGTTIEDAAEGAASERAADERGPDRLAGLIEDCLLADLERGTARALSALQRTSAASADVVSVMRAVPPLAEILRYGTARALPEEALRGLVDALLAQVTAGLEAALQGLDEDESEESARAMEALDRAVGLLESEDSSAAWSALLLRIATLDGAAPRPRGFAARRALDAGHWDDEQAARRLSFELSSASEPSDAAAWLEGFLGQNAEVLLHERGLLDLLDDWVRRLAEESFEELLPVLRRTFSAFEGGARRRIMAAVREGANPEGVGPAPRDSSGEVPAAFAAALPGLLTMLGFDESPGKEAEADE